MVGRIIEPRSYGVDRARPDVWAESFESWLRFLRIATIRRRNRVASGERLPKMKPGIPYLNAGLDLFTCLQLLQSMLPSP